MNLFTHIYNIKSTITILYLFSISGSGIKKKKRKIKQTNAQRKKLNLKNENVQNNGFIDLYSKKYFIKSFGFNKKVYDSVLCIGVT